MNNKIINILLSLGKVDRKIIFVIIGLVVFIPLANPDWINIPIQPSPDSQKVFDELSKQGIEFDCSIFLGNHSHGGRIKAFGTNPSIINIDGRKIKEFPINSFKFLFKEVAFSGGGYFRFLPYQVIKRLMYRSAYIMTYFHPRDFDKGQPIIEDLSYYRLFKSYYGLKSSFLKAERYLGDFDFVSLSHADKLVDWDQAQHFNLINGELQQANSL